MTQSTTSTAARTTQTTRTDDREEANDDAWVVVRRFDDPRDADAALDLLRHHGVSAALHAGGESVVVQRHARATARELLDTLDAHLEGAGNQPFRGWSPAPADEEDATELARAQPHRHRAAALVLAVVVPIGGGHFYARHNASGLVLASGIVGGALGVACGGPAMLGLGAALLVAFDALASIAAVGRFNRQAVPSEATQVRRSLGAVALAFAAACLLSPPRF